MRRKSPKMHSERCCDVRQVVIQRFVLHEDKMRGLRPALEECLHALDRVLPILAAMHVAGDTPDVVSPSKRGVGRRWVGQQTQPRPGIYRYLDLPFSLLGAWSFFRAVSRI